MYRPGAEKKTPGYHLVAGGFCIEVHGWTNTARVHGSAKRRMNLSPHIKKSLTLEVSGISYLKPGGDLLSHGNPHTIIGDESFHF